MGCELDLHLICVRRIIESPVLMGSSASKGLTELTEATMLILAVIVVVVLDIALVVVVFVVVTLAGKEYEVVVEIKVRLHVHVRERRGFPEAREGVPKTCRQETGWLAIEAMPSSQ